MPRSSAHGGAPPAGFGASHATKGREATLGPTHPDTLTSVNNLGVLRQDMGKHVEALPLFRRALEGREATLGPTHKDTLISVHNLGVLRSHCLQARLVERRTLHKNESGLEPVPFGRCVVCVLRARAACVAWFLWLRSPFVSAISVAAAVD